MVFGLDTETTRLIVLVLFSAFVLFFGLYSLFAVYHALRFGFKGTGTAISVVLYLAVSTFLLIATFGAIVGAF